MLAAFVIVFREMLEAGLIVGIVLTATRGIARRGYWVGYGVAGGVFGACLLALFAGKIGSLFQGVGQELFNATVLMIAVSMLSWHNIWMAKHGRELSINLKQVGASVASGRQTLMSLATVVCIAVLREGSEVVLFLYGIFVSGGPSASAMILGLLLGVVGGAFVAIFMYAGLLRVPVRHMFRVTSALIALMAAGLAAQAIAFIQQAGYWEGWSGTAWNSSVYLSEQSIVGRLLHTLLGYTDAPTWSQLGIYISTLVVISGLTVITRTSHQPKLKIST